MSTKSLINFAAASLILISSSACHKMYFHNGANAHAPFTTKRLHHEFVYELIEMSRPVDMAMMCGGKSWDTVEIERTFLNGLISGIQPVYGQWTVQQSCK